MLAKYLVVVLARRQLTSMFADSLLHDERAKRVHRGRKLEVRLRVYPGVSLPGMQSQRLDFATVDGSPS
jgi:hypothetical protein